MQFPSLKLSIKNIHSSTLEYYNAEYSKNVKSLCHELCYALCSVSRVSVGWAISCYDWRGHDSKEHVVSSRWGSRNPCTDGKNNSPLGT